MRVPRVTHVRNFTVKVAVLILSLLVVPISWSAPKVANPDQLRAAYLVNFIKFVEWPAITSNGVINFCISKHSPVSRIIRKSQGVAIGERKLMVTNVNDSLEGCHVLFWDKFSGEIPVALSKRQFPMLLPVSDMSGSLHNGFTVEFFQRDLRLQFAINVIALREAEYKISSKLLQIATIEEVSP